ncbi:MAG: ABC transporter permease [Chloroflexi bacterium]|nr:ABC transporter permease [Chloroflexota bacterium]
MASSTSTVTERGIRLDAVKPRYLQWAFAARKFVQVYPFGAVGGVVVVLLMLMTIVPGLFTPLSSQDAFQQSIVDRLDGPSRSHWFGRDQLGRDIYARLVFGARLSITIGFGVVVVAQGLSVVIGIVSGYFGGWFDTLTQRLVDIGIAVPGLVFIILVVQTLQFRLDVLWEGHGDELAIIVSLGILIAASSSRTIRGVALSLREEQFVEAARSVGASDARVMVRHMAPNVLPIVIVSASILVGVAVLVESSLSFLGYGVQPPEPSWGRMLSDAREQLIRAPHLAFFPGLAIFFTVFSFNMLGDALRDKLDPRLRGAN